MTDIELEKILLIIVVVQTAEEAGCLPLVASTIHGRNDFLTFVAQAIGQIHLQTRLIQDTISLQTEFCLLQLLCLETTHYMEVVLLSQREVILGISLEVIVVLLIFILMHIGTLVVNDRIAGNIMVVEHLLVPVACCILRTIGEIDMSSPVLDRLNQQVHLLVQDVTLLGILTCCSQTECWGR